MSHRSLTAQEPVGRRLSGGSAGVTTPTSPGYAAASKESLMNRREGSKSSFSSYHMVSGDDQVQDQYAQHLNQIYGGFKRRTSVGGGADPHQQGRRASFGSANGMPRRSSKGCPDIPVWQETGRGFLASNGFQLTLGMVILTNAIVIGMETDHPDWECWTVVEMMFLGIFTFELMLRLVIHSPADFFDCQGVDIIWNVFDTVIVTLGLIDVVVSAAVPQPKEEESGHSNATLFRICKLVRMFRILRIFKILRFLKQLYILVYGFADAAQAVFWVTVLMTFSLYICSILLVKIVGRPVDDDPDPEFWSERFGTIQMSMFTLFELMSVPDLDPYSDKLGRHPLVAIFFIGFIIFGSFGMIALLTGVISESMFEKNQVRVEEERNEKDHSRLMIYNLCLELFDEQVSDALGEDGLSKEEIARMIPEVVTLFDEHLIPCSERELTELVMVMDADEEGIVSRDRFAGAVISLVEDVRPLAIIKLNHRVTSVSQKLDHSTGLLGDIKERLSDQVKAVEELKSQAQAAQDATKLFAESQTETMSAVKAMQAAFMQKHSELLASLDQRQAAGEKAAAQMESAMAKLREDLQELRAKPAAPQPAAGPEDGASKMESLACQIHELAMGQQNMSEEISQRVEALVSVVRESDAGSCSPPRGAAEAETTAEPANGSPFVPGGDVAAGDADKAEAGSRPAPRHPTFGVTEGQLETQETSGPAPPDGRP